MLRESLCYAPSGCGDFCTAGFCVVDINRCYGECHRAGIVVCHMAVDMVHVVVDDVYRCYGHALFVGALSFQSEVDKR